MKQKLKINKQYGIVNKTVMQNKNISANAKALYTYLCARSGNKNICNPTIPTILKDLNICEATFHKLKRELIENKIIDIVKIGQGLQRRNHYKLLHNTNKNFGYVYLDILISDISLKSKAIYGLLACFSGIRFVAYPLAKVIYTYLKISRNTYFTAIKMLKNLKYIITKQLHINGRFANCNYYINGKQPNKQEIRYIFKFKRKNKIKTTTIKTIEKEIDTTYTMYESIVQDNIEWNSLLTLYKENHKAKYFLENILSVLTNTIYFENKDLQVNGITVISDTLKSIYNKLTYSHIKTVVENLLATTNKINNIRQYIKVALYNSYYQTEYINFNIINRF